VFITGNYLLKSKLEDKKMKKFLLLLLIISAIGNYSYCQANANRYTSVEKIPAVLIVDDPPINVSYVMRKQMEDAGTFIEGSSFFERTYLSR
jgi:hypothetical protein